MSERELRMWRESAEAYEKRTLDVERFENVSRKIRDQAHSELAQVAQLGHVAIPVDDAYWLLQRLRDLQRQLEQAEQLLREHVENFDERLTLEQYPTSLAARTFAALGGGTKLYVRNGFDYDSLRGYRRCVDGEWSPWYSEPWWLEQDRQDAATAAATQKGFPPGRFLNEP